MKKLKTIIIAALVAMPSVAFAAPQTFQELANLIVVHMNALVIVMITAAIAVYFWGISKNVQHFGEQEHRFEKMRAYFFWGIIVLFVMVSLWGILRILQNSLFGGADAASIINGTSFGSYCQSFENC